MFCVEIMVQILWHVDVDRNIGIYLNSTFHLERINLLEIASLSVEVLEFSYWILY